MDSPLQWYFIVYLVIPATCTLSQEHCNPTVIRVASPSCWCSYFVKQKQRMQWHFIRRYWNAFLKGKQIRHFKKHSHNVNIAGVHHTLWSIHLQSFLHGVEKSVTLKCMLCIAENHSDWKMSIAMPWPTGWLSKEPAIHHQTGDQGQKELRKWKTGKI